jgi:D,D-heptose 1,7-bisphosphate phosphatase
MIRRQAVVLVGGKGTRLGVHASNCPKPLMPLDGETVFLDEVLFDIVRHGFDDIILAAGHLGEQVTARYDGTSFRGARVRVVVEATPMGTGGALSNLAGLLEPTFLLANGDTSFDFNLRRLDPLLSARPQAIGVLGLRRIADAGRYGRVVLEDDRVVDFREKAASPEGAPGLINGGIGLFRRELVDLVDHLPCSIETGIYPRLASEHRLFGREFDGYFLDIGLPETLEQARRDLTLRHRRSAVFFDRDGVINRDLGHTWRVEDLCFIPGAIETIRAVNDIGALAIIVSNQAGIARGMYSHEDVARFHAAMQEALALNGAHIDAIYVCGHHPDAVLADFRHPDHPDRKPNPGMILRALEEWPIDPEASLLIGDMESDIEAAHRAKIRSLRFQGGNLYRKAEKNLQNLARVSTWVPS